MRRTGLPGSGDLRLEEEMLVLLHPPPPRHHDSQPGSYNLDPQSHELHSGKRLAPAHQVVYWTVYVRSGYSNTRVVLRSQLECVRGMLSSLPFAKIVNTDSK